MEHYLKNGQKNELCFENILYPQQNQETRQTPTHYDPCVHGHFTTQKLVIQITHLSKLWFVKAPQFQVL